MWKWFSQACPFKQKYVGPKMQNKYDKRLLKNFHKRNPTVNNPTQQNASQEPKTNERLAQARASAIQIANKRPLPPDRSTLRKKKKTELGDKGRRRLD